MGPRPAAPVAALVATTDEARAALDGKTEVRITTFPFKVGRESRSKPFGKLKSEIERRISRSAPLNDLYLVEPPSDRLHISREHFVIDWHDGGYVIDDRGSACGTIVAGRPLGARSTPTGANLNHADTIVVGTAGSPYVFRFDIVEPSR